MQNHQIAAKSFEEFLHILDILREKCPWDKKQTMESLKTLTIEEVYELNEAISNKDFEEISKELGDVFLHLCFYAKIASEENHFSIFQVIEKLKEKLIYRHPHIFSDVEINTEEEVKQNWEKLKMKEGRKSIFDGIPNSLPSLVKAFRIQDKAKSAGFKFNSNAEVLDKIREEIEEFKLETNEKGRVEEFGDILFSLINFATFNGIDPNLALEKSNNKFIKRVKLVEVIIKENAESLSKLSNDKLQNYWSKAKEQE
ncbi:MAG: nucleoside triphosphate pyrophosphohydrolase [Solirubrobacteraceae bacterium]